MGRHSAEQDSDEASRAARIAPDTARTPEIRTAKAGFSELVLVCRKCAKRQGVERKRLGRALKRVLKSAPRGTGRGKIRVLETGCLGPCPKRMLTLATPDSLARRRVILIDPALDDLGPAALGLVSAPQRGERDG